MFDYRPNSIGNCLGGGSTFRSLGGVCVVHTMGRSFHGKQCRLAGYINKVHAGISTSRSEPWWHSWLVQTLYIQKVADLVKFDALAVVQTATSVCLSSPQQQHELHGTYTWGTDQMETMLSRYLMTYICVIARDSVNTEVNVSPIISPIHPSMIAF